LYKFRLTEWAIVALAGLAVWVGFYIFLFILERYFGKETIGYVNIIAFIIGLFVILTILSNQRHYKKPLRNPKYRGSDD